MCVLVVDDDKATRRMLARVVARFPLVCEVLTASDGAEALEVVAGRESVPGGAMPISHITMDNQMPVMTGQDAVRALRARGCTVRVVGLTGNIVGNDRRDFLAAGADEVLGKPVQRGDLMKALFRPGR
jgi:CheY-like chemotaxis protein